MTTPKKSFKQLSILRKALSNAHTGEIIFETENDKAGKIVITVGDLINDEKTVLELKKLLSEAVSSCELITERIAKDMNEVAPPEAFMEVMNQIQWHPDTLNALRETFTKLPPVNVRMVPLHRYGYNDGLTYLMLHHESLREEKFTPKSFLDNESKLTTLEQKIKALVLGYCLGLITPEKTKPISSTQKKTSKRANIANRILNKIRGI
ncbi:MAG: hypothetical protein Q9N62_10615 [Ghiorsea sp.]|nr:hypothetical protein [Ghiorsea sp.]